MPWFVELQKQYAAEGLQVVGVAMDDASPNDIEKFANDLGVNYPILVGEETVGTHSAACSSCLPRFTLVATARWWIRCSV